MAKKSINKSEVEKLITEYRENGKTDQEIYDELAKEYEDKKGLAILIIGTVTTENKTKYRMFNYTLLGLLAFMVIVKILILFSLKADNGKAYVLLLILIVPLFTIYFMYDIAKYRGPVYRFCGFLTIIGYIQTINSHLTGTDLVINTLFAGIIAGLCFYLERKMFPSYKPRKLKTDSKGEYIMSSVNDKD